MNLRGYIRVFQIRLAMGLMLGWTWGWGWEGGCADVWDGGGGGGGEDGLAGVVGEYG